MAHPKLLLIEGLPGSGKTTTAQFAAAWLARQGVRTAVFLEGDLAHPADFESAACLDAQQYAQLRAQFPAEAAFLASQVIHQGEDYFFHYGTLQQTYPHLSAALLAAVARYEIYELSVAKYQRLLRQRWQQFTAVATPGDTTFIFECCFLQNPLTMMLGRHDESLPAVRSFILELAAIVSPLQPRWLYLHPGDVQTTLTRIAQLRPQAWLDFVIAYHTEQGHGQAQGWQGFAGLVSFYEMRQALELALLPELPFAGVLVEHTDWAQDQKQISNFLAQNF